MGLFPLYFAARGLSLKEISLLSAVYPRSGELLNLARARFRIA